MLLGTVLLVAATLAVLIAFSAAVGDIVARGDDGRRRLAQRAGLAGLALVLLALLLLAGAFLVGDLSIFYVWRYVDLRYAWFQRLSGLWIGREGSLLLWTGMTFAFGAIEEARHALARRRGAQVAARSARTAHAANGRSKAEAEDTDPEPVRRWARAVILGLVLAMLVTVLLADQDPATDGRQGLFSDTPDPDVQGSPFGRGVNPQLIIAFNAIHPPIVFVGYALTAIISAFAVGHMATGQNAWLGPARRWAHVAFLFLTLGVTLGGLWAYIALGWGGYWAWDPVEVGSIVPWIVVTTFLHAAYRADGRDEFTVAAPLLGFLALPASILSTFIVRAGGVWVSVHSFIGPGDATSAWGRYVEAFSTQPEVKLYTGLLVLSVLGLVALLVRHVGRLERAAQAQDAAKKGANTDNGASVTAPTAAAAPAAPAPQTPGQRLLEMTTLRNAFLIGVVLLALLGTVTVTILFQRIDGFPSDAIRAAVYTERTGPIALAAVLVMGLAIGLGALRKTYVLGLLGGALAIGAIGALLFDGVRALAMAVPLLAAVAVIAGTRIVLAWKQMTRRGAIRFSGIHMVHLGVAVLLLGHGFVSTYETFEPPVELAPGEAKQVGPYLLRLETLSVADTDDNGRMDRIDATVRIWEGERDLGTTVTGFQYYEFQSHYKPRVGIDRMLGKDVYLAPQAVRDPNQGWLFGNLPLFEQGGFEASDVDAISIQVSTLPYINLVWSGAGLMVLGAALLSYASWSGHRPTPTPGSVRRDAPAAA